MTAPRLHFIAGEASGDLLGREVIDAVRAMRPDAIISGVGAEEMAAVGVASDIDISPLSVVGLLEGVKIYPTVKRLVEETVTATLAAKPDVVVLIDSWGFTIRVAKALRARAPDMKLVKLVGPQIWATRPGRAKTLAALFDHVMCIHEFEMPYYEGLDIQATVIGNPALSRDLASDAAAFRTRHGMRADQQMMLVLPGSRAGEIRRVAPVLMAAARDIRSKRPDLAVVIAPAKSVQSMFAEAFPDAGSWATISTDAAERYDAMAAADLALACSGTVTSELAMQGTPMIVGYKTGWVTWGLVRGLLYQKTHITLLNIASDDTEVVPEFVQTRFKPDLIVAKALDLLADPAGLAALTAAQNKALTMMGEGSVKSAEIAARAILSDVGAF